MPSLPGFWHTFHITLNQTQTQMMNACFEPMTEKLLDAVMAVEAQSRPYPWQRSHFADCLGGVYQAQVLHRGNALLGYWVAMQGFLEVHLLNLAVAPMHQRQGWAKVMLDSLCSWAQPAHSLWLEVRVGNSRAIHVYESYGFRQVATRQRYYPCDDGEREDALVMCLTRGAACKSVKITP